jgi:predicted MFS family arabinose efflux permease
MRNTSRLLLVAAALALGPCLANGLARFSYGLVLPAMREDLGWTFAEAGWFNSANGFGYLAGALLTGVLVRRFGTGAVFRWSMLATSASLLLSGLISDYAALVLLRVLTGAGAAPTFICGGVLAASLFPGDPARTATAITVYFGGSGLGILITGAVLPPFFDALGPASWPLAWQWIGVAGAACTALAWRSSRVGAEHPTRQRSPWPARAFVFSMAAYLVFGGAYIVYMTYLAAWMRAQHASSASVAVVWALLGVAVMASPLAWRSVLAGGTGGKLLAASIAATALGVWLAWYGGGHAAWTLASAFIFGGSVFAVPSAATALVRHSLHQPAWGSALSTFTILFAFGQMLGPLAGGWFADLKGSLDASLLGAVVALSLAAALALWQPRVQDALGGQGADVKP